MKVFFLIFFFQYSAFSNTSFLDAKKRYDLEGMEKSLVFFDTPIEKKLATSILSYYQIGEFSLTNSEIENLKKSGNEFSVLSKLFLAEHLDNETELNKKLLLFFEVLDEAQKSKDDLLINSVLLLINDLYQKYEIDIHKRLDYVRLSREQIVDSTDLANTLFYEIIVDARKDHINQKELEDKLNIGLSCSKSNFHKALFYNLYGNYFDFILEKPEKAIESYDKALFLLDTKSSHINNTFKNSIKFNKITTLYNLGKYKIMIDELNTIKLNSDINIGKTYLWKSKSFEELSQYDSAHYYLKKFNEFEKKINRPGFVEDIIGLEFSYDLSKKEVELASLTKSKNVFKWQVFFLAPLALGLTWLAYRYYNQYIAENTEKVLIRNEYEDQLKEKVNLQSNLDQVQSQIQDLEKEREETIERLQQLKEVVTKDFIILQDKSKVYVEELMYIQSDDHYLKVHLFNKKDNFVRGKISQIIEELPPNFIRCHRSYIINENYIEKILINALLLTDGSEVPVSKKYREFFNPK